MTFVIDCVYLLATVFVLPFWYAKRRWSGKRIAPTSKRLGGFPASASDRTTIWIHGVSVGEIRAARGIVDTLARENPGIDIVLSVTTEAGFGVATKEYPDRRVFYSPLDFSWVVRSAFDAIRPRAIILMELELWPNLLAVAHARSVPVIVANAKMSERSARGYRRALWLHPHFLDGVRLFGLQHETFRPRLLELGIGAERLKTTGVVKVDNLPASAEPEIGQAIRRELGIAQDALCWLAGSTHPGEEKEVFDAFEIVRRTHPSLTLLVAPRHIERAPGIAADLQKRGYTVLRRTQGQKVSDPSQVILLDTMGELDKFFACADMVFLGGSLVPVGGHNILEPAARARPVIFGPHTRTVGFFAEEMLEIRAGFRVVDAPSLATVVARLASDADERRDVGDRARAMVDRHRGAVRRTVDAVYEVLARSGDRWPMTRAECAPVDRH